MKRILVFVVVILVAALLIFSPKAPVHPSRVVPISVTIQTGSAIATVSGVTAQNAFQALQTAAKKQNVELKTKQYDFGVFVQQIGMVANTKDKSWIYFVNGKAGTVAADKQKVNVGDIVEWKYMTPTVQ